MEIWKKKLNAALESRFAEMVELRRHLHMHPELSGKESDTSLLLFQKMDDQGLNARIGPDGFGVIVDSRNQDAPTRFGLRADIDALMIEDCKSVPYRSQAPGIMHACGHDAHAAMLTTALLCLDTLEQNDELPWPVTWRGIFQPSEETAVGAQKMIELGAIKGVDAIISQHVDPTRQVGRVGLRKGIMTASCDAMKIVVHGIGGHAARPHESHDPIAAAAQLISTIYQFVPRATDSLDSVVVSIGEIKGGENPNVIPERVSMRGTLRTLDQSIRENTIHHIRQMAKGIEEISGTRVEVNFDKSIPAVRNDGTLFDLVCETFDEQFGAENRDKIKRPSMGSEDFADYLEYVPGVLYRLGTSTEPEGSPGLHTPNFDIDEKALLIGAKLFAHTAIAWSKPVF